jgi:Flp pilus assembly protein TadD
VGLGDAALERGDPRQALEFFGQAHERDAADPIAALRLAVLRARTGQVVESIPLFTQAVERRPDDADALAGLAAALARTGRPREAVPYFERAVRAGSRSPAVLNGLGFARLESGDTTGAFQAWRSSLALDPNQPRIAEMLRQPAATGASR